MAGYNLTRTVEEVLEHFNKEEKNLPSFTVHLHPEYWTLNNGSKFLYNNPVAVGGAPILRIDISSNSIIVITRRHTGASNTDRFPGIV